MIKTRISSLIKKQQFNPDWLGIFINPFYFTRRELYKQIVRYSPQITGRMLDIGCGSKPYKDLFAKAKEYIGIEYDSEENRRISQADIYYDGTHFPFTNNSFDSAIATEVLEHVFNPDVFLTETARVLKPDGYLFLSCPFAWDEHSQPYDYARYSSFGLVHLLEKHKFKIIKQDKTATDIRVLCQMISCYIHKNIPFKNYRLRLLSYLIFITPLTLFGIIFHKIFPKNKDLYLSNVVLAQKL